MLHKRAFVGLLHKCQYLLTHGYGTCIVNRACLRVIGLGILVCTF